MPVKLGSKLPLENEARIEIVPLIDIMFFLLASFMAVSLSMTNLKRVAVNLPTATTATTELKHNLASISVDKAGILYFEKNPVGATELTRALRERLKGNPKLHVIISGDKDSRHDCMMRALDAIRAAGIQNVSFDTRATPPSPAP
ncbi:MAG: biopolymer transporter ExbD [Puniceicoccales bacterium]|jgi:biopolymer transport protein ExbD|nr:biopolymer transporter ExbD [Puniceicoccales bacterium]